MLEEEARGGTEKEAARRTKHMDVVVRLDADYSRLVSHDVDVWAGAGLVDVPHYKSEDKGTGPAAGLGASAWSWPLTFFPRVCVCAARKKWRCSICHPLIHSTRSLLS